MASDIKRQECKLCATERERRIEFWFDLGDGEIGDIGAIPPGNLPIVYLPKLLRRSFEIGWRAHKGYVQKKLDEGNVKVIEGAQI